MEPTMIRIVALALLGLSLAAGPATAQVAAGGQSGQSRQRCECTVGVATWYGARAHGRRTSDGGRFDLNALTAAHRTFPFNTRVRVTNLSNGRSVIVRITDRGPRPASRIIDVSYAAAQELDMVRSGIARVRLERLRDG